MSLLGRVSGMTRVLAQARRERQVPYLADADFARIEREVRQGFRALVGDPVRVDVEPVAAIPAQPGGKVAAILALPRA